MIQKIALGGFLKLFLCLIGGKMKELEMNPYVIQMDKFVSSLDKLSKVFLSLEERKTFFSEKEVREMCGLVCDKTCSDCPNRDLCLGSSRAKTYGLLWKVFQAIEDCGSELNIEIKRELKRSCVQAPKLLKNTFDIYKNKKQELMWSRKMAQNREGCAIQLGSFAQMIQHATKELDASIFSDEYLEKKIRTRFTKEGIKILTTVFLMTEEGRYEIHITARAKKGDCVATKDLAQILSECCDRTLVLAREERTVLGTEYCTVTFVEGPKFHTISGVAKIGKGHRKISGDSFSMMDLPGGKQAIILSDGMGAGETANRESQMVVELLEELLDAGFPKETALQMLNTALVIGREEVRFSTIDMSVFDLYNGKCEILKAGASVTFIKSDDGVECVKSTSLPIGVVSNLEIEQRKMKLQNGNFVIMVTDGVLDALPVGEQELLLGMIIEGIKKTNPREMAQHILEQVLECSGEVPMDDMTVLVVGMWSLEK